MLIDKGYGYIQIRRIVVVLILDELHLALSLLYGMPGGGVFPKCETQSTESHDKSYVISINHGASLAPLAP